MLQAEWSCVLEQRRLAQSLALEEGPHQRCGRLGALERGEMAGRFDDGALSAMDPLPQAPGDLVEVRLVELTKGHQSMSPDPSSASDSPCSSKARSCISTTRTGSSGPARSESQKSAEQHEVRHEGSGVFPKPRIS